MSIWDTHPTGWVNPVNLRAYAALPAAGAWDAAPTESSAAGAKHVTLSFTYLRGAAGGAFDFQIEYSIYAVAANVPTSAAEWVTMALYSPGAVAGGADSQSRIQREFVTYQPTGATAEDFAYGPIPFQGTIERVRVRARESGVVGTPGSLQITMELSQ